MAQSVKMVAVKPDDLSLVPRTHMVERDNFPHAVLLSLHSDCSMSIIHNRPTNVCVGGDQGPTANENKTHDIIWGVEST